MTVTVTQVDLIEAAVSEADTYNEEYSRLRRQLDALEAKMIKIVFDKVNKLRPAADYEDEKLAANDEEAIQEIVSDFIYGFDNLVWTGNCDWDSWEMGEQADAWTPSTC